MELDKRSSLILWSCVAAATGGIVAIVAVARWKSRTITDRVNKQALRDVKDVIADCYRKIHAIEARLPNTGSTLADLTGQRTLRASFPMNGAPTMDA